MTKTYFLICNKILQKGNDVDIMRTFIGSKLGLKSHIEKVNTGNYSYIITDFKT